MVDILGSDPKSRRKKTSWGWAAPSSAKIVVEAEGWGGFGKLRIKSNLA